MPSWLCLSRLVFGAGCGTRLYRLLIHCLFVYFHSQPKLRAVAGFWKVVRPWDAESVPRVPKARDGESTREGFPPLVRGISPEKILGSERFYCILSVISVYKFSQCCRYVGRNIRYVWASDNTIILNTTISTPHRITMAPGTVQLSVSVCNMHTWQYARSFASS